MRMRHTLPAALRRGLACCPRTCSVGSLRWSRLMLGQGAGRPRPRPTRQNAQACILLLSRGSSAITNPTRESTLLLNQGRHPSGCTSASLEQLDIVRHMAFLIRMQLTSPVLSPKRCLSHGGLPPLPGLRFSRARVLLLVHRMAQERVAVVSAWPATTLDREP